MDDLTLTLAEWKWALFRAHAAHATGRAIARGDDSQESLIARLAFAELASLAPRKLPADLTGWLEDLRKVSGSIGSLRPDPNFELVAP